MKYKFYIEAHGGSIEDEDVTIFESKYISTPNYIAEDAAQHYFNYEDGYEAEWPLIFSIFSIDDKFIGNFEVELESEPSFMARIIKNGK